MSTTSTTTPTAPATAIHWFEIPVSDLDRAQRAYETVLGRPLRREAMGPQVTLAVFEYAPESGCGGCLIAGGAGLQPGRSGTLVYLNAEPSLNAAVGRAESLGLRIEVPRVDLPGDMGAYAVIIDTEGNRVGLHAQQ
ncbi:MAG: VOC family protein [Leptothrix sp. (in: b-proteobacteria)]